jgi:AraC-like DNA-binding protein
MKINLAYIKKSTWLRFALAYLIIVLIMSLLFVPIYIGIYRLVHDNTTSEVMSGAAYGLETFEKELLDLYIIAGNMVTDQKFVFVNALSDDLETSDYLTIYRANEVLKQMSATLRLSSSTRIYFRNNSVVLSGKQYLSNKNNRYFGYAQYTDQQLRDVLFAQPYYQDFLPLQSYFTAENGTQDVITYMLSLPLMNKNYSHAVMISTIPGEQIMTMLGLQKFSEMGHIRMIDASGQVLLEMNPVEQATGLAYNQITSVKTDRESYTFMVLRSEAAALSLEIGIPASYYSDLIRPVRNTMFQYLFFSLLIGVLVSIALAYFSARPMQSILRKLLNLGVNVSRDRYRNDYQYIDAALKSIQTETTYTQQEILSLQQVVANKLLENMIRSRLSLYDEERFRCCCPDFPAKFRMIAFNSADPALLAVEIKKQIPAIACHLVYCRHLIAFVDCSLYSNQQLRDAMSRFIDEFSAISAVVSTCYCELNTVCQAYRQVSYLLKFITVERLIFADDSVKKDYTVSINDKQCLSELLVSGNIREARKLTFQQWYELSMFPYPDNRIEQLFYLQIGILSGVLLKIHYQRALPVYDDSLSITQLAFLISDTVEDICRTAQLRNEQYADKVQDDLLRYVNTHCYACDFSIVQLESTFNMSSKTLSKQFKSQTGMNLAEYVERKRLNKAENMLIDSRYNVNDVAVQCGFASQNTFYKVFKRTHGVSPSTYRDNYFVTQLSHGQDDLDYLVTAEKIVHALP